MRSVRRDERSGTTAAGERETNETKSVGGAGEDRGGTVKRETIKCCFF